MNKSDALKMIAEKSGLPLNKVEKVYGSMLKVYYDELRDTGATHVHGIGIMTAFDCTDRMGVQSSDGYRPCTDGRKYVRMRISKCVKNIMNPAAEEAVA